MRNIALILMYNGTAYHGWQVQKTEVTVAQTLERGLSMVCGEPVKCTGCGRTDAGVHAEHYVANFRTSSRIPVDRIPFAVNTHIPEDIVVKAAYEVAEDFNAIGSCIRKEYTYRIYNSRIKNPFYVDRAYFYPKRLDEQVMDRAARAFEGTHDFAAVRSVGTNVRSTVRTIYYCHVTRNGELLELKVCANGFLYNMVRAITGTVLYAAEGKLKPEDIPVILDSGNRTLAGPTAPPGGLYLTRVWYEDERLNGPVGGFCGWGSWRRCCWRWWRCPCCGSGVPLTDCAAASSMPVRRRTRTAAPSYTSMRQTGSIGSCPCPGRWRRPPTAASC